jgi:hypothetical protein
MWGEDLSCYNTSAGAHTEPYGITFTAAQSGLSIYFKAFTGNCNCLNDAMQAGSMRALERQELWE